MSLWTQTHKFQLTRDYAILFSAAAAYAQRAYPDNELVTDISGLRIADRLRWDYTTFSLALEKAIPSSQSHIWAISKVKAQEHQTRPFFHLDLDFLLYEKFNSRIESAQVACQSKDEPEFYFSEKAQELLRVAEIPTWTVGFNAALLLWNDLELRTEYVKRSLSVASKIAHLSKNGTLLSIISEQATLGEILYERGARPESLIPIPSICQPEDFDNQFSHFWAGSKRNPKVIARLEKRFARDFPLKYKQAVRGFELIQRYGLGSIKKSYGY